MKIAVIGGGSTYTPELVNGLLARVDKLPVSEVWLMDNDAARLEVVGGFARRMVAKRGEPFRVILSTDQREAVRGAAYVLTQLRVGQMAARREDEYLGRRHGLIGQETTGIGGMANALRTIPVILEIAADMRALAPGALLVNFTNPSGLVTQALSQYAPDVSSVGVCNQPLITQQGLLKLLEKDLGGPVDARRFDVPEGGRRFDVPSPLSERGIGGRRALLKGLGLNHLSWYSGLELDGEEVWPRLFPRIVAELRADPAAEFDAGLVEALGVLPTHYLTYFYHTDRLLAAQAKWPPSRAEEVMEVERALLRQYADPGLSEPPPELMKRGGAYYSTVAAQLLNAHYNNLGETHMVNTRQGGAVPGWPEDWVLELACRVDREGIHALPAEPLPPASFGLLAQVKSYELLTVQAAVHGDRRAAFQALLANPLGPRGDRVGAALDDLLATHRAYLPRFWQE